MRLISSTIRRRVVFAAALATDAVGFGMEQWRITEVGHDLRDTGELGAPTWTSCVRSLFHSELKDGVAAAA